MVQVTLFRTPEILKDGQPVSLPFSRAQALVFYLAAMKKASRSTLISLLWENREELEGLKYLRNAVYHVRRQLGEDILLTPNRSIILLNDAAGLVCDYDELETLVNAPDMAELFLHGFSVKRAPAFDEWVTQMREQLQTRSLGTVGREVERLFAGGKAGEALALGSRYLQAEPYDEQMVCRLMRCCSEKRNYAKAAEIYQALRKRLSEELGTEPLETTTRTFYEVMGQWNARAGTHLLHVSQSVPGGKRYHLAVPELQEKIGHRIRSEVRRKMHLRQAELLYLQKQQDSGVLLACARQYELAGKNDKAWEVTCRELNLRVSAQCSPFSCRSADRENGSSIRMELKRETAQRMTELSGREKSPAGDVSHSRAWLLSAEGQLELLSGAVERADRLFEAIPRGDGFPERDLQIHALCLQATDAVYRQCTGTAEQAVAAGLRLLKRERNTVSSAWLLRLKGCCLCLRKSYDKASYYLREAMELLESLGTEKAGLQLAAAYADYARVCRYLNGFADASFYFKKALAILGESPVLGKTWIYVHYGRTVYYLEDHSRARELFEAALCNAEACGELWGKTAAAAYTAYYCAYHEDYDGAENHLNTAMETSKIVDSGLEKGILCYVCMMIRHLLDEKRQPAPSLKGMLRYSAEGYARRGVSILSAVPDVHEAAYMADFLKNSISTGKNPRAEELYSRKKHFMTE